MLNELRDEDTGIEIGEEPLHLVEPVDVRRTMIRLQQLEREIVAVKRTKKAVDEAYDAKVETLAGQCSTLRSSLAAWCEQNGKISFPDVGTAYLTTAKPKIAVRDLDEFRTALGDLYTKEVFDETAAKGYALERAVEDGEILPGVELVPGGPSLAIRKT